MQTSRVLPFQTSSTSRLSSNRMKRYFSGSGLALLDELGQVALLGVGEVVGFFGWAAPCSRRKGVGERPRQRGCGAAQLYVLGDQLEPQSRAATR